MKKVLLGLVSLACVVAMGGDVLACGDKLVIVGRGIRAKGVKGTPQRAAILLYADAGGSLRAALEEGNLRKGLERAGHRLRSVGTREELKSALGTGSYDLLFADFKSAALVEGDAKAAASKPTVLPTLFNPTEAELAAASQQYKCVLKAPRQQKDYMAVVNEALALRAKELAAAKK